MIESIELFMFVLTGVLGFLFITIIDRLWFQIEYKKAEKGLEILEHYHYGIGLFAISFILINMISVLAFAIFGMATSFIYHEARQKNLFAFNSAHFKGSTVIGLFLVIITVTVFIYY